MKLVVNFRFSLTPDIDLRAGPLSAISGHLYVVAQLTASYVKLSLDFLTLQGNLACKEADLAGSV